MTESLKKVEVRSLENLQHLLNTKMTHTESMNSHETAIKCWKRTVKNEQKI